MKKIIAICLLTSLGLVAQNKEAKTTTSNNAIKR